jgi:predicted Rossmann-fold nucleotide-binding protein
MREAGIKESVAVFGGARVVSPERAREALDRALAEAGTGSWTAEAGKKVTSASQDLARSKWFSMARDFGARVAQDGAGEIAVAVDGGPGIAEAVGLGAAENGGPTAAFILRAEKAGQATPGLSFEFRDAALRGRAMRHEASALVYFPGGFTTTNALSDTFALMRKGKAPRVPIILVGPRAYWENLFDLRSLRRLGLVSDEDLKLLVFAEDAQEAWAAVRAARRPKPGSL